MSVAVLLDNFVAASARLERESKEGQIKVHRLLQIRACSVKGRQSPTSNMLEGGLRRESISLCAPENQSPHLSTVHKWWKDSDIKGSNLGPLLVRLDGLKGAGSEGRPRAV